VDDVTERVRLEAMMVHSEKMLSVGGLAAGMAHELNNPLAGILHNLQVMRNRLKTALPRNRRTAEACGVSMEGIETYMTQRGIFDMMERSLEAGRRAAHIVNNLLTFSGGDELHSAPRDLGHLLDRAVALASNDFELRDRYRFKSIEIVKEYNFPLPEVLCESGKIQQVFYNVIKNAAQAMAEKPDKEKSRLILRVKSEGGHVRVDIRDNGPGMDDETRKRLFEPFFTTRNVGDGVGLGLSVSYFIVSRDHNGSIEARSTPGKGATIIIRLPQDRRSAR
jgi:signal transduction histidine kinase